MKNIKVFQNSIKRPQPYIYEIQRFVRSWIKRYENLNASWYLININVTDTRNKVNLRFIKLETFCGLKEKKKERHSYLATLRSRSILWHHLNCRCLDEENHSYLHSEECHMLHLSSFQNIHIEQCCCYYWSYILLGLSNYLDTCQNYKNRGWKLNQHKATLINLAELPPT